MTIPFIVAELGAAPAGGLEHVLATVRAAAEVGADAVKIQLWSPDSMCLMPDFEVSWKGKSRTLAGLYAEAHTPWEWVKPIFECASMHSLTAFASPFDKAAVDFLEEHDCPIYKIASFELVDIPLIKYVASKGKPMVLSTGMATQREVQAAIRAAKGCPHKQLTLLQCTSSYPADASQANLMTMVDMRAYVDEVGLSDHTCGTGVAIAATALGATMIEKHFCLSRQDQGLDSEFSLEPAEFKQMVQEIRRAAAAIGTVQYGPSKGESTSLRRSLYFAKDLPEGHILVPGDLVTARPAQGMEPRRMDEMMGSKLTVAVSRGEPVTISEFYPG